MLCGLLFQSANKTVFWLKSSSYLCVNSPVSATYFRGKPRSLPLKKGEKNQGCFSSSLKIMGKGLLYFRATINFQVWVEVSKASLDSSASKTASSLQSKRARTVIFAHTRVFPSLYSIPKKQATTRCLLPWTTTGVLFRDP